MAEYKFNGSLIIDLKDIYYDVRNNAFVTGNSRKNGDNHEIVAGMQASDDEEDSNKILRAMQNAMGDLLTDLAEYDPKWYYPKDSTFQNIVELFKDNESKDKFDFDKIKMTYKKVILSLATLPANFNPYVAPAITQNVHRYIYNRAMNDWFLATNKDDAQDFNVLATNNLKNIREAINKRVIAER